MSEELLPTSEAAHRLGITPGTLYDWLSQSRRKLLRIRGQPVTIRYYQGGAKGQGRIRIAASEVARILGLLEVFPEHRVERRTPIRRQTYPGILVPLGRPDRL
jgi:transposase-like protein